MIADGVYYHCPIQSRFSMRTFSASGSPQTAVAYQVVAPLARPWPIRSVVAREGDIPPEVSLSQYRCILGLGGAAFQTKEVKESASQGSSIWTLPWS